VNELSQNPQLWQANSKVSALNQKLFHGATPIFPQTPSRCHLPISKLPFAPTCCSEGPVEKKQETTRTTRSGIKTIFLEAMVFLWEGDGFLYIVAGKGEKVQGRSRNTFRFMLRYRPPVTRRVACMKYSSCGVPLPPRQCVNSSSGPSAPKPRPRGAHQRAPLGTPRRGKAAGRPDFVK
jgi:hypothetical protein